jgi:DNA gyrase subunit A
MLNPNEKVEPINVAEEVSRSFLDYSMSVIISRALPDARDGLKPSQRRILYAMHDLSLFPGRQHRKCAKICGDTSGNYHPHGEAVIYPTLVHMAQPWAMRERLIDGQGNFGSVEGDPPAAMRYTEARMTHLGAALMTDMDKDTVDFVPNYDETRTEPTVFPAAFPNLLVNGGTGIAVGMATNIPPHNLTEVIDGICAQIDNPDITLDELMKHVKGPDFPTGCMICGMGGIRQYFETGRGSMKVRGKAGIEELKGGREQIVITQIPYGVNRATLVERIAQLVNEKVLTDISYVGDQSDENTRVVIELKRDANPKVIIANLYKHTALESSFAATMLAIDHGRPKLLPLKDANAVYIDHRREVILRRTRYELRKAEERAETLEGYLIALANLDEFLRIIRGSANRDEARVKLLAFEFTKRQVEQLGILIRNPARLTEGRYAFSEQQADEILNLRLYQLTGLEREKVVNEYKELVETINDLRDILAKEQRVFTIIKKELREIRDKYGSPRLTEIAADQAEINVEDLIVNEGCIISITHGGFIKRTAVSAFRAQRRGGKGVIGMQTREGATEEEEGDFVEHLFTATTHDYLMFFTATGRAYVEKVYEIPEMGRAAKGRSIANILELKPDEKIAATIRVQSKKSGTGPNAFDQTWDENLHIVFATQSGIVKKSNLSDYANVRRGGIIAIQIEDGDRLIDGKLTNGNNEIVLITRKGMSLRFHEEQLRDQGRNTVGVWGIRPEKNDHVVGSAIVDPDAMLLVAGENGIGKRTGFDDYRRQSRGGKGIITMKTGEKTGEVVGALTVRETDEIMLITNKGQMVRTRVKEIRETGRNTMGVKLMDLRNDEKLQAVAPVVSQVEEEEAQSSEASAQKS